MTTRLRDIDANIEEISLDVLSPEEALQLLINIIGEKRVRHCEEERRSNHINSLVVKDIGIASLRRNDGDCDAPVNEELAIANELCEWLGYLPLGIELVGRYIKRKPPHLMKQNPFTSKHWSYING